MPIVLKYGSLNLLEASGSLQACNGTAVPLSMHIVVMCRPSYKYCSNITVTHFSFRHTLHQKEGERLLLFPPVCLRIILNSNTPPPPTPMFRQSTLHSFCIYWHLNYLQFVNRKILLYYKPSLLVMKQCQSFTSQ